MRTNLKWLAACLTTMAIAMGTLVSAGATERISINVVNERPFILSLELRDMRCGGNVIFREQLDAGESREIEICTDAEGRGALGATFGSGCSQVKRTDIRDIEAGDALTF